MIQVRFRKLFIGGVDSHISEKEIKDYFKIYGEVMACTIHRDRETGRSRGFGFITFEDPAVVDAVQADRPHVIKGCEVTLKRAVPKELFREFDGLLTVNRIFVGGLRQEVEESDLQRYFEEFGQIRRIDLMIDRHTKAKRGFAFVEFEDYDPVDKVVLQGQHTIQGQDVTVRKAKSRLEMELLRQQKSPQPSSIISSLHRNSLPPLHQNSLPPSFQDNRAFGDTLASFARPSFDNMDCPFHYRNRRRFY